MASQKNRPLDKTSFGIVKDAPQGYMDTHVGLGDLLLSLRKDTLKSRKVRIQVGDIPPGVPVRNSKKKIVSVGTLYRWYKDMTGKSFDKQEFLEEVEGGKIQKREESIRSFKMKCDSGSSKPIA